jgi:hypothetical protein
MAHIHISRQRLSKPSQTLSLAVPVWVFCLVVGGGLIWQSLMALAYPE